MEKKKKSFQMLSDKILLIMLKLKHYLQVFAWYRAQIDKNITKGSISYSVNLLSSQNKE